MFVNKKLNINEDQMCYVRRQEHQLYSSAVDFVQELDDDHHVRCHKDISIFLFEHGLHKLHSNAIIVFQNPVSFHTVDFTGIGFIILVLFIFPHYLFEICDVYV